MTVGDEPYKKLHATSSHELGIAVLAESKLLSGGLVAVIGWIACSKRLKEVLKRLKILQRLT